MQSYIGKDNPNFEHEKKKDKEYDNYLQNQVRELALKDPLKYLKHQSIGESYMNLSYELEEGVDNEGDLLKYRELKYLLENNYIENEDLSVEEKNLLNKFK